MTERRGAAVKVVYRVVAPPTGGIRPNTITAGHFHTCGLDIGGAAWRWGSNGSEQLGKGGFDGGSRFSPVEVVGGHVFTIITAGYGHTCALDTGGDAGSGVGV